jgi:cardiolipin synthase
MGSGFGSIESALHDLFVLADDEVVVVAYAVSGAAQVLFQQFEKLLEHGIRIRMLINRYEQQHESVKRELKNLQQRFPTLLQLFSFVPHDEESDLHAKIILVDRKYALVGSANLSLRGLMDNHEFALVVEGTPVADITRAVDMLFKSDQVFVVGPRD